jgi:restriction system protein
MARQKIEDNLFYVIFRQTPTWVTAVVVVASYPVLRYLLPGMTHGSLWAMVGSAFAPYFTFVLALIALYAEADKYKRRQILKQQSSLDTLRGLTWQEFELLVGEAYRRQGYKVEETGGRGPDGGVDLVLRRAGEVVLVQCKRWKQAKVGAPTVRELRGAVARDGATRGIFVTSGLFTREAKVEAQGQPLELVDGAALLELVKQAQRQTAPAQRPQTLAASSLPAAAIDIPSAVPPCPKCAEPMLRRTARSGANAGSEFWGCPSFPNCRGTRPI